MPLMWVSCTLIGVSAIVAVFFVRHILRQKRKLSIRHGCDGYWSYYLWEILWDRRNSCVSMQDSIAHLHCSCLKDESNAWLAWIITKQAMKEAVEYSINTNFLWFFLHYSCHKDSYWFMSVYLLQFVSGHGQPHSLTLCWWGMNHQSCNIYVRYMQYQLNILLGESYWTTKMKYHFVLYEMCAIFL
jgi:hypothetical protein